MEFADIVVNRIEAEDNSKNAFNALISFSSERTAKALGKITEMLMFGRQKRSFITFLNLINKKQADGIDDENIYKTNLLSNLTESSTFEKATIRTFVKQVDNTSDEILKVADEQESDIILMGIGLDIFKSHLWEKYIHLRENSFANEDDYIKELGEEQTNKVRRLTSVSSKSDKTVAILVGANFDKLENIFVPILKEEDILIFSYVHQIAKIANTNITVWDAIGIIDSNIKIQKLFSTISKKAEGEINLWNNNKKISVEFMNEQDLMIIGHSGWDKLICTPLCWIQHDMPSTLIIKDKRI